MVPTNALIQSWFNRIGENSLLFGDEEPNEIIFILRPFDPIGPNTFTTADIEAAELAGIPKIFIKTGGDGLVEKRDPNTSDRKMVLITDDAIMLRRGFAGPPVTVYGYVIINVTEGVIAFERFANPVVINHVADSQELTYPVMRFPTSLFK